MLLVRSETKRKPSVLRPSACKDETALLCGAPSPQALLRWNALTQPIEINPVNRKAMNSRLFGNNLALNAVCPGEPGFRRLSMARTVLVVDDDPIVLNVTSDMLADIGCETVTALSGPEALDRLSQGPQIEILISDINMPGMDGYELVRQAKHMRGDLQVILLSGREGDGHGLPFIRKPFFAEDLIRTMKQTTGLC
jgi:two-component system, cell cycle response regulator CpdR